MSFLQQKWNEHQVKPLRRYSSQREFEADWVNRLRPHSKPSTRRPHVVSAAEVE